MDCTLSPGQSIDETYRIPREALELPGAYRIYVDGLGYCELHVGTYIE